jgi:hypothetical protein
MQRDFEKKKFWDEKEINLDQKNASHRIHYGYCNKFGKDVSFLPNTCQIDTQECFKHRRDKTDEGWYTRTEEEIFKSFIKNE